MMTADERPSDERLSEIRVPRAALLGAAALIALTVALAAGARLTGTGAVLTPQVAAADVVRARALHFVDLPSGGVAARDAASGALVAEIAPGTNGFLRGALRGVARKRRMHGIAPEVPVHVVEGRGGRLVLEDPATGVRIDLRAFGPTNAGAFEALLGPAAAPPARASLSSLEVP